jgi:hypothetical protein
MNKMGETFAVHPLHGNGCPLSMGHPFAARMNIRKSFRNAFHGIVFVQQIETFVPHA